MIVDGRALAQDIVQEVKKTTEGLFEPPVMRAITVSPNAATHSYLRAKVRAAQAAGIAFEILELAADASTQEVIESVKAPGADAIIVQLPLPGHIDTEAVLAAIPYEKDADALSPAAKAKGVPVPPVAAAVEEVLARANVPVPHARVAVIGKGRLVGEPVARRLSHLGAQVSSYDDLTFTPDALREADIIVSGAGVARLVTAGMVKEGVVLIDAGTSESAGAIVGDIDPEAALRASVYTPVPGGIGPITVACLMRNCVGLVLSCARKI